MKFSGIFKGREEKKEAQKEAQRNKERELDNLLRETDIKLRLLYNNYKVMLHRELMLARGNKQKEIRNQDNYSRIGIAYYSMLLITRAQDKMEEMISYRSLYNCVNGLHEALDAINSLDRKMGKVNVKKVLSSMKKVAASSGGTHKELKRATDELKKQEERLSDADKKREESAELVSDELIEKLIQGVDVEECVRNGDGVDISPDAVLDELAQASGDSSLAKELGLEQKEENGMTDLDRMKQLLAKL